MNRIGQHNRIMAVFFIFLSLLLSAVPAFAKRIRCPVCDQTFPEDQAICPNDGTDLNLLGKEVKPVTPPEEPDTEGSEAAPETGEEEPEEKPKASKYTRHDRGGARKRVGDVEEDEGSSSRTDRNRRIGDDRRVESAAEKRRREKRRREEYDTRDNKLRVQFKLDREQMLAHREERARQEDLAQKGFWALKRRALWAQGAPLTSVGVRLSWMGEGKDAGPLTGAEVDFNLVKTDVRVGLSTFLGVRVLSDRGDLMMLESISIGMQRRWRYSPYIVARAGVGVLISNRFGEDVSHLVRAIGVEAGVDSRVTESLVITPSVGYVGYAINDAFWSSVTMKISIGF